MKFIRVFAALMAVVASDTAFAADIDTLETKEVITTTKTIERETDEGELEPVEKEITTETLIDIPIEDIPTDLPQNSEPPICQFFPLPQRPEDNIDGSGQQDYFIGTEEFIENNADDDSDIISEVEGQVLINEKGEVGYALDEVPEELLKDNPVYTGPTIAPKDLAAEQIEHDIEDAVDDAIDDLQLKNR